MQNVLHREGPFGLNNKGTGVFVKVLPLSCVNHKHENVHGCMDIIREILVWDCLYSFADGIGKKYSKPCQHIFFIHIYIIHIYMVVFSVV